MCIRDSLPSDTLPKTLSLKKIPVGLPELRKFPKDNPLTEARVALGRKLFFSPVLSGDGKVSCASCHQPKHGFASPDKYAIGIGDQVGKRNSPSLLNRAFGKTFFWDGRSKSLEEQAILPIVNKIELGNSYERLLKQLRSDEQWVSCLLYTSPSPRDATLSRMPSSA